MTKKTGSKKPAPREPWLSPLTIELAEVMTGVLENPNTLSLATERLILAASNRPQA